jgi:hypothetical protein
LVTGFRIGVGVYLLGGSTDLKGDPGRASGWSPA